jgi:putative ABC transport system permease protein
MMIIMIISVAATIGLSIKNAADDKLNEGLANTTITGQISLDRSKLMSKAKTSSDTTERQNNIRSALDKNDLTLNDYQKYASASSSVSSTYYSEQSYLGKTSSFQPVESTSENAAKNADNDSSNRSEGMPGGMQDQQDQQSSYATDFTITGFSDDTAVSKANSGNYKITSGKMFTRTSKNEVVISNTLASFNNVNVGDTITVASPIDGSSTSYTFTIVGIYKNTSSSSQGGPGNQTSADNAIYTSMTTLTSIGLDASTLAQADGTTTPKTTISYTYVFSNVSRYQQFKKDVKTAGLSTDYTVSSTDVDQYESSMTPLRNLSKFSVMLLMIIFAVGAIILIVLTLFNIRERKYEVGVLTAIGIRKGKVAAQFMIEILIVTMFALGIGAVIGAVSSAPVSNQLLSSQVSSMTSTTAQLGRSQNAAPGGQNANTGSSSGQQGPMMQTATQKTNQYVKTIDASVNLTVLGELLLVGMALALLSGLIGVIFVMRFEPLQILSERS